MTINHLITLNNWSINTFNRFFITVDEFRKNRFMPHTDNKIVTNLFYEPSTRTSSSFYAAAKKVGADVISINNVNYSSVAKGETLEDTIRTLACYSQIIVLRHPEIGAAKRAADISPVPIINAGDGAGEHPTQTLLDLYTIYKKFGQIEGLKICFIGDNKNSRTVHSLGNVLEKCARVYYCDDYSVDNIPEADIYYLTRVQKERGSSGSYELTKEHIDKLPKNCIVMHPFPRNEEIPQWFDNDPRAKYFEQMSNGLYVRMAILYERL